jgi:ABC-type branched-subunit amino acid transport system substrate-binding protein
MQSQNHHFVAVAALISALGCLPGAVAASDPGIKDSEILIGQCAALTGPAQGLGTGLNAGLKAAFDEANAKGGIHGRQIRLLADDDGYDPDKCVDCTGKMIEDKGVFALAGYVGTPTGKVAAPMAQEDKIPLVGLFTGAMLLREPVQRYVINIRASYDDETEALVEHLTKNRALQKIAVFYQNDSFGFSGLSGVEKALTRRKLALVGKGSFERNTLDVKAGLAAVMAGAPDAVVIVAPYEPTAAFVRAAREAGLKAQLATISFVGTESLIAQLGAASEGMIISQVVPSPTDATLTLSRDYRSALQKSAPTASPTYVSFEGYVSGRVLVAALDQAGKDLSREKLIDTFHGMSKLELGGMVFSFSPSNHQGSNAVYITTVKDGKAQPTT